MFQNLVGFPSYEKLAVLRTKDPNIGEAMILSDRLVMYPHDLATGLLITIGPSPGAS